MTNKLGYFNALKDTYSALADFPFGGGGEVFTNN